jgi:hypothetical protein
VKLTLAEAKARVEEIRSAARDDERAHELEDALRRDALKIIARGDLTPADAAKLARVALSTEALKFSRWCA